MKIISNLLSVPKQLISFLAYGISFLFPRNKKVWLYGNMKGSFRDNAKYLFIYNSTHFPEIKHIWISQSAVVVDLVEAMGFKAANKFSLTAFYYALTAKVYIYNAAPTDTVHGCLRGNAYCFNLWHGVPFKKIEYDIKKGSSYKSFFNPVGVGEKLSSFLFEPKVFRYSNGILTTSPKLVNIFCSAFRMTKEQVFIGPYPRNEVFKISQNELEDFINKYESSVLKETIKNMNGYNSVVIYLPTFRDDNPDFMNDAIPDFEKLHEVCKKTNTLFLIKAHVLTQFNTDLSAFTHIRNMDTHIDVYPLLPYTHALVSDYSSIIFDYSLMDKKIIFYAFDKPEYLSKSRESYFDYAEVFSKDIVSNFDGLVKEIEQLDPAVQQSYPLPKSFLENEKSIGDITAHLKAAINY